MERSCPLCGNPSPTPVLTITTAQVADATPISAEHRARYIELGPEAPSTIGRCSCGMVFSTLDPSPELLDFAYRTVNTATRDVVAYSMDRRRNYAFTWHRLLMMLDRKTTLLRVVDFGSGWSVFLAAAKGPGVEVLGIEQNPHQATFAREHGVTVLESIDDVEAGTVDVLLANQVLEHVHDPLAVLSALRKLVRPDAVAFLTVPNFGGFDWRAAQRTLSGGGTVTKDVNPWEHLNYFDRDTFRRLLASAGFAVSPYPEHRAVQLARRLVRRTPGTTLYCRPV